jgi:hypothetical protein
VVDVEADARRSTIAVECVLLVQETVSVSLVDVSYAVKNMPSTEYDTVTALNVLPMPAFQEEQPPKS